MSQLEDLREIAAASAQDMAGIDGHLDAVAQLVRRVEERWRQHENTGLEPRLARRHFGKLACRFSGDLTAVVVARLQHLLGAQHSPVASTVPPTRTLRDIAASGVSFPLTQVPELIKALQAGCAS